MQRGALLFAAGALLSLATACSAGSELAAPPEEASLEASGQRWVAVLSEAQADDAFAQESLAALRAIAPQDVEVAVLKVESLELSVRVAESLSTDPALTIGIGGDVLEEMSYTAAEWLDREFVAVDAQPGEPTANLTTVLFDRANCPEGAACAEQSDVFDPEILTMRSAPGIAEALAASIADVEAGRTGGIVLYTLE